MCKKNLFQIDILFLKKNEFESFLLYLLKNIVFKLYSQFNIHFIKVQIQTMIQNTVSMKSLSWIVPS